MTAHPHTRMTGWSDTRVVRMLRRSEGRPFGILLLLLLLFAHLQADRLVRAVQVATFDVYQRLLPRQRESGPVVIVAIDEASLARFGQWPWPRSLLARLIDTVGRHGPAAIGVDILLPEPDRSSPSRIAETMKAIDPMLSERLPGLADYDVELARSVGAFPVSLGVAGIDHAAPDAAPTNLGSVVRYQGADPKPYLQSNSGALTSFPVIHNAAPGHGLLSVDKEFDGVVRRIPLVATARGTIVPSLAADMLRLAMGKPPLTVKVEEGVGVVGVEIGELAIDVERDGAFRVLFSKHVPERFVSAMDVLDGRVGAAELADKLVLVGVTGLGLVDYPATPVQAAVPGVEIHAQLLENIFDGVHLHRPAWGRWAEWVALFVFGAILIVVVPEVSPRVSPLVFLAVLVVIQAAGWGAYVQARWLFDAGSLTLGSSVMFVTMLAVTLAESDSRRKSLESDLQRQRESAAKLAGELNAARDIQMGFLPPPDTISDPRIDLDAMLVPAASVGGDLYDFFMLDADRLFVLVGDVAGKGVPASLFMAVSKTLTKSVMMREPPNMSEAIAQANREIVRDNSQMLFVTVFAAVIDLRTGVMDCCRAGHEAPLLVKPNDKVQRLECAGGPPIGLFDELRCPTVTYQLAPGEILCAFTDGVPEAMNPADEPYGSERNLACVNDNAGEGSAALVRALYDDVKTFASGAPPSDDITILALRWMPNGRASGE